MCLLTSTICKLAPQKFLKYNIDCLNGGKGVKIIFSVLDLGCTESYGDTIHVLTRINCEEQAELIPDTVRVACKLNQRNIRHHCCKTCQKVESVGKC